MASRSSVEQHGDPDADGSDETEVRSLLSVEASNGYQEISWRRWPLRPESRLQRRSGPCRWPHGDHGPLVALEVTRISRRPHPVPARKTRMRRMPTGSLFIISSW